MTEKNKNKKIDKRIQRRREKVKIRNSTKKDITLGKTCKRNYGDGCAK